MVLEYFWRQQTKNKGIWKIIQKKHVPRRQTKNERIHERILERIQKESIQQFFQENKKTDDLKSAEVDVVTKFIKNEVESSIDDADDTDDEQDKIIGFR